MNAFCFRPWGVWMLCLGLVLPGVGHAAQVEPTPGTQQDAPRSLLADEIPRGVRILGEVGGGVVSAGVLGVVGALTGGFLCNAFSPSRGGMFTDLSCLLPSALGLGLGVMGGASLGVWWMGELLGGDGSFLSALGGGLLGVMIGAFVTALVSNAPDSEVRSIAVGASLPVLGLAGFVLGYELTQKAPRWRAGHASVQPLVSITPRATVLGLSGAF